MQLTRWSPRHSLGRGNVFFPGIRDDFFGPLSARQKASFSEMMPSVDIYEKDGKVTFEAEVPGFKKEDLKVDVRGKIITLSGERKTETGDEENRVRKERRYGRFERSFSLGFEADSNTVEARYENGILTIVVARPQEEQAKQIQIN
jgi:HSP20 family protein